MQEATDTAPRIRTLEPPPPSRQALQMETASLSDVGRMRTENQDACGEVFDSAGNRLLIVADGMGGHAGGSTASRICVETVCREFQDSSAALDERLRLAIQQANADVCEVAGENAELAGMGTTAVALALEPTGRAWVAWVGDSRAYRLRQGELQAITDDHSWVAEAVRMGAIDADEAETHPRKNQLVRSVGADPTVDVDVRPVEVRPGDRFLICSDGLWGEVSAPEIAAVLGYESPVSATRKLVDRANEHGGPDNITVQILAIGEAAGVVDAEEADAQSSAALPVKLIAAASMLALCLAGFGVYALLYGGGGFPERAAAEGEVAAVAERPVPAEEAADPAAKAAPPEPVAAEIAAVATGPDLATPPAALGVSPPGSLEPVASGPLEEAEPFRAPAPVASRSAAELEAGIERFLGGWSRSVTSKDWAAYHQLGLPASRDQFERDYAKRNDLRMSFELIESSAQDDGTVKARVRMSYGYDTTLGRKELQTEYKIRLRESPRGLRYAGGY